MTRLSPQPHLTLNMNRQPEHFIAQRLTESTLVDMCYGLSLLQFESHFGAVKALQTMVNSTVKVIAPERYDVTLHSHEQIIYGFLEF